MAQHQQNGQCESLKVTRMIFDLLFIAEQQRNREQEVKIGGKGQNEGSRDVYQRRPEGV
jgi:hypothetical protein